MAAANDGLRFILELCSLIALGWWGFAAWDGVPRWVIGLGAPLLVAVVWATFVTPNGALAVGDPLRLLLEVAVFGSAVAALVGLGRSSLGLALAGVVVLHLALTFLIGQR